MWNLEQNNEKNTIKTITQRKWLPLQRHELLIIFVENAMEFVWKKNNGNKIPHPHRFITMTLFGMNIKKYSQLL